MNYKNAENFIRNFIGVFLKTKVTRSAAEISYYLTLSVFPFLICLNWIISFIGVEVHSFEVIARGFIPESSLKTIAEYIKYVGKTNSAGVALIAATFLATSASSAFRGLYGVMEDIHGRKNYKGFWQYIFAGISATIFLFATYLFMLISVMGKALIMFIDRYIPLNLEALNKYGILHALLLFLFLWFMISLLYRGVVSKKSAAYKIYSCSCLCSAILVVESVVFSSFIAISTKYSLVYGSLASIICLMLWIFICMNIIIATGILLKDGRTQNK